MTKKILLFSFLCQLFLVETKAQNFDNLSFGTDSTFEVATWNIEHFPKNGNSTLDYVQQIIDKLDVEIIAVQELKDTNDFKSMFANIPEYKGYFQSSYFAGLAYIYNQTKITIDTIYEIYTTQPYWNAFPRSPMVMECRYLGEAYVIINNHLKCCGDGFLDESDTKDEENRRLMACNYLKTYIDNNLKDEKVIVLGDLNDEIHEFEESNVFQMFIDDVDNYLFADMEIALGESSAWSYPTWPSHLDHILINSNLFNYFDRGKGSVTCFQLDNYFSNGWSDYDYYISDHRPVVLKLPNPTVSGIKAQKNTISVFPNPVNNRIHIKSSDPEKIRGVKILNLKGQMVFKKEIAEAYTDIRLMLPELSNGIYLLQLNLDNATFSTLKIIVNHE